MAKTLESKPNVLMLAMPDHFIGFRHMIRLPNLGMTSVAGSLRARANVRIADLIAKHRNFWGFLKKTIEKFKPTVVGISSMGFQYKTAKVVAKFCKAKNQNCKTVLGGYHATCSHKSMDTKSPFDFLVIGEGERPFAALVDEIASGKERFENINGVVTLDRAIGRPIYGPQPKPVNQLDDLPLPYRESRLLNRGFHFYGMSADVIESTRGCTFNCKFCSIREMYGKSFRKYSPDRVIADIKRATRLGAKSLLFADDNITIDVGHLEKICELIVEHGLTKIHYHTQASGKILADNIHLIGKMASAGFKSIFIGLENVSRSNLKFLSKMIELKKILKLISEMRKHRIISTAGLIVGNPMDDKASIWKNWKFARLARVDIPYFQILTPYPSTEIRKELESKKLITNPDNLELYDGFHANIKTNNMGSRELQETFYNLWYSYYGPRWVISSLFPRMYPRFVLSNLVRRLPRLLQLRLLPMLGRGLKDSAFAVMDKINSKKETRPTM